MFEELFKLQVGDLVVLATTVEWEGKTAIEGEIGLVARVYVQEDDGMFFDYLITLGDGIYIPVWIGEVRLLKDGK